MLCSHINNSSSILCTTLLHCCCLFPPSPRPSQGRLLQTAGSRRIGAKRESPPPPLSWSRGRRSRFHSGANVLSVIHVAKEGQQKKTIFFSWAIFGLPAPFPSVVLFPLGPRRHRRRAWFEASDKLSIFIILIRQTRSSARSISSPPTLSQKGRRRRRRHAHTYAFVTRVCVCVCA